MARNPEPPPTIYYAPAQLTPTCGVDTSARTATTIEGAVGYTPVLVGEYKLVRKFVAKHESKLRIIEEAR